MATISFTPNLERHLEVPPADVPAGTVAEALEKVFASNERLRSYILDDQGALRKHVVVFVDSDRRDLDDRIGEGSHVYVMQALSGG